MNKHTIDLKCFAYNGERIYYYVKDVDINLKEVRGREMASAYIVICDDKKNQRDVFHVYDERYNVLYAMPDDAKRWYEEYLNETK